jgi:GMP synthase (glutamine-hydrolysing)
MDFPTVLVVDFGAQYAQLIARRIREAGVYSEIVSSELPVDEVLARKPAAIVLSGGPSSVYAPGAPQVDPALFESGVPAFGICYGFQAMAQSLGGSVAHTGDREYGGTPLTVTTEGRLFGSLPVQQSVWMSHGDAVSQAPPGFTVTATSTGAPVAAFEDVDRKLAGVQFHPEVRHTSHGQSVLEHFLFDIAGLEPTWTMANVVEEQVERIRAQIGEGRALCALSGGVDSAVAAALVQQAIGDRLTCVYVDHGLMREGET